MSINTLTAHRANIHIPFGELNNIIEWCKANCIGEWQFEQVTIADRWDPTYNFYFESERDYVAFVLWKK